MKLLLDENIPVKLKYRLSQYDVRTVAEMSWSGLTNGELLAKLQSEHFEGFITSDKNLQYQQNFINYPIPVFVLAPKRNTYDFIMEILHKLIFAIENQKFQPGINVIK